MNANVPVVTSNKKDFRLAEKELGLRVMTPQESVKQQRVRFEELLEHLGKPSATKTEAFLAEREVTEPESGLTDDMVARVRAKITGG